VPVDKATTEGKLFERLGSELYHRHDRLERLDRYYKDVAHDFFRTSRTNFAELVAEAPRERMKPTGIRTAATEGSDEDGDEQAWAQWINAGLPILSADVHQSMLALGDGYVIVSWDDVRGRPVVTAEDPRTGSGTSTGPNPSRLGSLTSSPSSGSRTGIVCPSSNVTLTCWTGSTGPSSVGWSS
jgi:hypothetical protein